MHQASYNDIAAWYDQYLREKPVYSEVILPNVLKLVGECQGEKVCDLACGQGWIARELARRGALVTGVDLAPELLELARRYEEQEPLDITYVQGDAQHTDLLHSGSFAGCVCVMALTNIPDLKAVFQTVRRILKPRGWFVFAIPHPCFATPHAEWISLAHPEHRIARAVTGYFDERYWFSANPEGVRGKVGEHHRMLSTYLNLLSACGLVLEHAAEPTPSVKQAGLVPGNQEIPTLLFIRAYAL